MIESAITQLEETVAELIERLEKLECLLNIHVMHEYTEQGIKRCINCTHEEKLY